MTLEIKSLDVLGSKRDRKTFVDFPYQLYAQSKHWVPPLKMAQHELLNSQHPFHQTSECAAWMVWEENKPLGRIMAIYNEHYNRFQNEPCGFFGFFEVDGERTDVTELLFQQAESFLKQKGAKILRGPVNPSTNYESGLLVEGFDDDPQLMMTFNPEYYVSLIEAQGLKTSTNLLAYHVDYTKFVDMPRVIKRMAQKLEESHRIVIRPISKKHWNRDVQFMLDIYNSAWEKNWGFVPMTKEEFFHTAKEMKMIVDENLVLLAEVEGKPAGFMVALPDYHQVFKQIGNGKLFPTGLFKLLRAKKYITRFRIVTLGIKEEFRPLGLVALFFNKINQNVSKLNYKDVEMSWILENNREMNKPLRLIGANVYKKYRIYEKSL